MIVRFFFRKTFEKEPTYIAWLVLYGVKGKVFLAGLCRYAQQRNTPFDTMPTAST